jgi:hypothetical protein
MCRHALLELANITCDRLSCFRTARNESPSCCHQLSSQAALHASYVASLMVNPAGTMSITDPDVVTSRLLVERSASGAFAASSKFKHTSLNLRWTMLL